MKIVAFSKARLVTLFPLDASTPLGPVNERAFFDALAGRYQFLRQPDLSLSREEFSASGLLFENGVFASSAGEVGIHQMAIHNDGLVIDASRTNYLEEFLSDLLQWTQTDWAFRSVPAKTYFLSEITVDFERPVSKFIAKYDRLLEATTNFMMKDGRSPSESAFSTLAIEFKTADASPIPKFILDRKLGAPSDSERFYCSAPLRTESHLELLQIVEDLIG